MNLRSGAEWSPEEDETIRAMAAANASAVRIAARLRRTVSGIQRRAMAKGIKIRSPREQRRIFKDAAESAANR
jgi:hypothetical protein